MKEGIDPELWNMANLYYMNLHNNVIVPLYIASNTNDVHTWYTILETWTDSVSFKMSESEFNVIEEMLKKAKVKLPERTRNIDLYMSNLNNVRPALRAITRKLWERMDKYGMIFPKRIQHDRLDQIRKKVLERKKEGF